MIPTMKPLLLIASLLFLLIQCEPKKEEKPFLVGQGTGINSATLMVDDIEKAVDYFRDSLGFAIYGSAKKGAFEGSLITAIPLGDMSSLELLAKDDSIDERGISLFISSFLSSNEGVRLFSLSSSAADSTFLTLTGRGFTMDSIQVYRTTTETPKGWTWDDGDPKRKSLDFNTSDPPAHFPRFIEKTDYNYDRVANEWRTYYNYQRMYNKHPNNVVGISALRILVQDIDASLEEMRKMGFDLIEQNDSIAQFHLFRDQTLELISAGSDPNRIDFLEERGEGVYALRFDVSDLDSTINYLESELPPAALSKSNDRITVAPQYAFGVQLEFVQESEAQSLMARTYNIRDELDSVAVAEAATLYAKYCALCHGENREGYAADHAPSLRSHSLLATSQNTNFMRYTIQYGRANTAMAGYMNRQGGPMEYIEIELLLKWLYEMAEVDEPVTLSREPVLGDIELGATVYNENCAVCHGKNGEGISAPALGNPMLLATATDHFLRYAIAEGRDGTPMIAFKDSLSDEKIDGLTAFLRSRASGWDIPQLDTVTIPSPENYVLNPENKAPNFDLRDNRYVSAEQVNQAFQDSLRMIILDARSEVAWRQMHIPGSIPVPYYEDPENFVNDIPNDGTQIVIYCACPHAASGRVMNTLRRHGFDKTAIIDEGILVWAQMGFPVRNGS
jgi:mono/diheme cytochrome c family protein/rhodanese-related sulfurtransferase